MINSSTKRPSVQLSDASPTNHSPLCESPPPFPEGGRTIITVHSRVTNLSPSLEKIPTNPEYEVKNHMKGQS
ncbi:hypothetical protein NPIL_176861 [Nephila pilipes]|uniref:Uncharacterized protein n=1 Tax=Nephila pilipes TaxID=299642 RepID=A0A8X6QR86_NEPPI|nr:hypothetical protein NPIL_176861 [Nephila pilipes]